MTYTVSISTSTYPFRQYVNLTLVALSLSYITPLYQIDILTNIIFIYKGNTILIPTKVIHGENLQSKLLQTYNQQPDTGHPTVPH